MLCRLTAAAFWSFVLCLSLTAQDRPLSFDVASIKLRKGDITMSRDPFIRGRTVTSVASTLTDLLTYAYEVRYDQLAGAPAWAGNDHYDIEAKSEGEGALTPTQSREMMRSLLAERFQLEVHRETQEVPVYELMVGKIGHKLKPGAPDATGGNSVRGGEKGWRMEAKRGTMEYLAQQLSHSVDRPVIDRTGLSGTYAFTFEWFPANRVPPPDLVVPSMFTAIQEQLGLKLESAKGSIEKLVVDRAEKPTEN
jgi:uncharacterized protein (TIGR03435 family)